MGKKLFIVGVGRCGTHTLMKILETVSDTLSLHEGRGNLSGKQLNVGHMNGLNVYLYHCSRRQAAMDELTNLSGNVARVIEANFAPRHKIMKELTEKNKHFCDVNRHAYNYINYIHQKYPDAKFVHLIRNGYDCVSSWYPRPGAYPEEINDSVHRNTIMSRMLKLLLFNVSRNPLISTRTRRIWATRKTRVSDIFLFNKNDLSNADLHVLSDPTNLLFYRYDKPVPYKDSEYADAWQRFDRIQKISWFWSHTNLLISEMLSRLPSSKSMLLRIEDLSHEKVMDVLRFAGLPEHFSENRLKAYDANEHFSFEWTKDQINKFNSIADNCMKLFGYSLVNDFICKIPGDDV